MNSPQEDIYKQRRVAMVAEQIAPRDVRDSRVLEAMRRVPRHRFVPEDLREQAYEDHPVRAGCGQTISQPYMVAVMTELLSLTPTDRVLEIGTGSGYQTAILTELAQEVVSIERHAALAESARSRLKELGYLRATVYCGDGSLGHPEGAPYNAILVTAGGPQVPAALQDQLAIGGRLVCPIGGRDLQTLVRVVRTPEEYRTEEHIQCIFVPLVGVQGWPGET